MSRKLFFLGLVLEIANICIPSPYTDLGTKSICFMDFAEDSILEDKLLLLLRHRHVYEEKTRIPDLKWQNINK